ncbi:MAG: FAD-dependent oxidoreductase, partial [Gammaproteobacteria bacterium]
MQVDYVIIGAGIGGLSIARELKAQFPTASIAVIEKEAKIGLHASGRNSGVLHAGIYYKPES